MNLRVITFTALVCMGILILFRAAPAYEHGLTQQNRPFITGGVSREEQGELESQQRRFTLWLITVDERSGAWLADATVEISDASGALVLTTKMAGPYLLADLDPGRYRLLVTLSGQTRALSVNVSRDTVRRVVVRFDTGADVLPDPRDRMSNRTSLALSESQLEPRQRACGLQLTAFAQRRNEPAHSGVRGAPA